MTVSPHVGAPRRAAVGGDAANGGLSLAAAAHVTAWQIARRDDRIELAGRLGTADAGAIWRTLVKLAAPASRKLDVDLRRTELVDGTIMALLVEMRASLAARGIECELVGASPAIAAVAHLFRGDRPPVVRSAVPRVPLAAQLGDAFRQLGRRARDAIGFVGELVMAFARSLERPAGAGYRSLPGLLARAGTDGVPIVLVLNFLVGFVMAYQSTRQLELYGANLYVADIVGISITRELAPLMTAIIISGRSGAAFAAELGTMRVSEEIDALRTMGFDPVSYLVVPRVCALALAAPILTLLGDVLGVLGGLGVAVASLDLTPEGYLQELRVAVDISDVSTGLVKSVAFGIVIAIIGTQQGLATRGAAAGVGRGTTTTVVYCLFSLVVLDTLFTMLFRAVGL